MMTFFSQFATTLYILVIFFCYQLTIATTLLLLASVIYEHANALTTGVRLTLYVRTIRLTRLCLA